MKIHIQIYVPKRPRTYEKHLLNLLKSSISVIFKRTSTIVSVETIEKLCQIMQLHLLKTRLRISQFLKIDIFLSFSPFSSLFPQTVLIQNVAFTHWKKASAPGKFEMVMKHPTLASFHVRNSSNNQDKLSPSTSGENTNARLPSIPDAKNTSMFHFNETTD